MKKTAPLTPDKDAALPVPEIPRRWCNQILKTDGLRLLSHIPAETVATAFFDPQYRGILDRQAYGNEGKSKEKRRLELNQMDEALIRQFIAAICTVLKPSGHLFLWTDKFHLCEGIRPWLSGTSLQIVDLIVWEKPRIGMGYRTRNKSEFLTVIQKPPLRAKGCWTLHDIPNVWAEAADTKNHPHAKPVALQMKLIQATVKEHELVLDPAAGSGSVPEACRRTGRLFIGSDLNGDAEWDAPPEVSSDV